jgi:HK97 family phage major capsid protein
MSEFIKTQEELRANLTMQIRDVIDSAEAEKRGLDSSELEKIDRIEADIRKADEAIGVVKRNEDRAREVVEAASSYSPKEESRGSADIFRSMARGEIRSHLFLPETRATLVNSVNTVPVDFLSQVYGIARLVGPMLDVSEVITRESGNDLRIPTYTAYSTAAQYAAGSAIADSEPTFSSILLSPKKQGFIVKIANELLDDAGYDIEATIAEQAGNAIGFRINDLATVGTGSSETQGIVPASALGVTSGTATAITADELISLAYSVDGSARRLPGVGFMANTATVGIIRRLKDDNGAYIYDPIVSGEDRLLGYPIFENPAMASIGTAGGTKPVVFGHLPSYKIVTTGLEVATSTDAYFENDVTAYRFTYRMDGALTHSAHVKHLVTAAA